MFIDRFFRRLDLFGVLLPFLGCIVIGVGLGFLREHRHVAHEIWVVILVTGGVLAWARFVGKWGAN